MMRCCSFNDHGLLCKSFFNFFSEKSAPFVIVMSMLFIPIMSDSFKLLLLILFCIALALSVAFLADIYSMRIFLNLDTFLGGSIIIICYCSLKGLLMDGGGIE